MLTKEKLKANKNNIMTIMENRVMSMTSCDRKTANLVANEVLNLDRDAEWLLNNEEELDYNIWCENLSFEDWKNKYENDSEKMKNLYDESHLWVRQNYQKGDECFVVVKYNEQEKTRSLVHTYLLRDKFLDVRGSTDDFDKIIEPFDCEDYETFGFNTLEQFINFVVEIMREMK